ncbi:hypothetical protein MCHIJ_48540 [Mycolicibacterium chitae]|uniref:Uncharacterized protein n=1 Tax=Mycolicibacterium chitae TaxID=1792 RepID=A0A3S4RIJ4_MYCCI|nr:hypothetical protein [Mycolicibacterium chitae]MCV7104517.1 hypothetical protein [Mycolicibacterium chitae]BBZ05417.1 hypothetical protein MCHIJ_48540 [Mycolicibacterium chitae]VEG49034.1 Uncharacterised protein [Mycolicibacterium chitae]
MTDGRQRRKAKQARREVRRASRRRREEVRDEIPEEVPLVAEVQEALAADHPLHLLALVSTIIEASLPQASLLESHEDADSPDLDDLVEGLIGVPVPETTALLGVLAELVDDPELAALCAQEVDHRDDELPAWISELERTSVYRAARMSHVLGDGDDLMLGVRLPGGFEMTCVAHLDHNLHSCVGDAFLVPDSLDAVLAVAEANRTDADLELVEMTLADAGAWLGEGLEATELMYTPSESDTWPACRPLVEWLTYSLPTGGSGYAGRGLGYDEHQDLLDRFFGSLVGMRFATAEHRELLNFCLFEGTGDPLRFSEVRLTDLLTATPFDGAAVPAGRLRELPDLLRAYVPFAHAQSGLREELTAEALAAIDHGESEYLAQISG